MAISIDWATKVITVPQADLTFVTGTLYELDTDAFRLALKDIEDDTEGIPFDDTHRHNTEVTVAGTTFARTLEIINGYSITFENGAYSVRLAGSNNNFFDVENGILNQNTVQIIAQNSGGLVVTAGGGGGGPTAAQIADAVWDEAASGHTSSGTFGGIAGKALTVAKFLGLK